MKRLLYVVMFLSVVMGSSVDSAFAFPAGAFVCRNSGDVPSNVYVIQAFQMGANADPLPFVDLQLHSRLSGKAVKKTRVRGLAAVYSEADDKESLVIGSVTLEFVNGILQNCRP